jgi:hypothetical protein
MHACWNSCGACQAVPGGDGPSRWRPAFGWQSCFAGPAGYRVRIGWGVLSTWTRPGSWSPVCFLAHLLLTFVDLGLAWGLQVFQGAPALSASVEAHQSAHN